MDTFILDVETFYSTEYSLTHMDVPSYVLDQMFEAIVLGVAENDKPPFYVDGPDIPKFLHSLPTGIAACSHNALFDFCVFSWLYNWTPQLILDTLAMSRTLLSRHLKSHSLANVAKFLNLPPKGGFLSSVKGMTRADIIANGMWQSYTDYCLHDVWLCREIMKVLLPKLPDEEIVIHDMIARCAVEPMFKLEPEILAYHLANVRAEKEDLLNRALACGVVDRKQLMSNPQFAHVLRQLGVDPPLKLSPTTNELTYAFARNDIEFMELRDHEDPRVQAVVEARLGFKSTLEETRTERMLNIAHLDFPHHGGTCTLPIPLKVGAAITHRLGGDWLMNAQNWGRQSPIRKAVQAPEGKKVVACDASQIEARLTAWFCGQWDLVEQFARGEDVYANFASGIMGYPVNKKDHPGPRFIGKTAILQLGFQSWFIKFKNTVLVLSTKDGMPIELSDEEALRIVQGYRARYPHISGSWGRLGSLISWMAQADEGMSYEWGPVTFRHNMIVGPSGLEIPYNNLHYLSETREWIYEFAGGSWKLFGGKVLENIIQHLARVATMQAALRVRKRTHNMPARFVHQAHDELIYLVDDAFVRHFVPVLTEEMSVTPDWAPNLPLRGETKVGVSYGDMVPV